MSREDVIVATFATQKQAEAACGHLQAEGIPAYVLGDTTSSPLASLFGLGERGVVYVPATDYQRAAHLLEAWSPQPSVAPEPQTAPQEREEADDDLWLCSLCGEALNVALVECPGCGTAREATEPQKRERLPWNRPPSPPSEHLTAGPPAEALLSRWTDIDIPPLKTLQGDQLASRALKVALLSFLFLPLGIWYFGLLLKLVSYEGEFSPAGQRKKYLAIALGIVQVLLFASICLARF